MPNRLFMRHDEVIAMFPEIEDKKKFIKENFKTVKLNGELFLMTLEDHSKFVNRITKKSSMEELMFALSMELNGIEYDYQPPKLTILEPFETYYKEYEAITYTPDFLLSVGDRKILVEVKGYIPLPRIFQYKIYDYFISKKYSEYEYCIVKWVGSVKNNDKELYMYHQSVSKKMVKDTRNRTDNNFWTLANIPKTYKKAP